jgi:hypothetical protein
MVKKIPGSASPSKNLSILTQKIYSKLKYDPGCSSRIRIADPDLDVLPIPDPGSRNQGVKKAPDPESATLLFSARRSAQCTRGWSVRGSALSSETSPAHTAICPGTESSTRHRYLAFALV